jgi:hypothetical protein
MHTLPCVQSIMHDVPIQSMHQMPSWGSWDASDDSLVSSFCASVRLFLIRRREIAGGLLASHEKESSSIDLQIFVWSPGLARKRVHLDRPTFALWQQFRDLKSTEGEIFPSTRAPPRSTTWRRRWTVCSLEPEEASADQFPSRFTCSHSMSPQVLETRGHGEPSMVVERAEIIDG